MLDFIDFLSGKSIFIIYHFIVMYIKILFDMVSINQNWQVLRNFVDSTDSKLTQPSMDEVQVFPVSCHLHLYKGEDNCQRRSCHPTFSTILCTTSHALHRNILIKGVSSGGSEDLREGDEKQQQNKRAGEGKRQHLPAWFCEQITKCNLLYRETCRAGV